VNGLALRGASVGVGATPPSTLVLAAQKMVSDIDSLGCSNALAGISTFQNAYNAWGAYPSIPLSNVYDQATHDALVNVNTPGANLTVPDVCDTGASPMLTLPTTTITSGSEWTPYVLAGVVAGVAVLGFMLWHHHTMTLAGTPRRRIA